MQTASGHRQYIESGILFEGLSKRLIKDNYFLCERGQCLRIDSF